MQNLTREEFAKIRLDYRTYVSRLFEGGHKTGLDNLKRLLHFIDNTPLIREFIQKHNTTQYNIETIAKEVVNSIGVFSLPLDKSEEIAFIYQLLVYHASNSPNYFHIARWYGASRNIQESVDIFNQQVVGVFTSHINNYLEGIAIDKGYTRGSGGDINIREMSGGQINHARDQAQITASYNESRNDLREISVKLLDLIKESQLPDKEKEETIELIEEVNDQIDSGSPKKSIINMATSRIEEIGRLITGSAEVTEGINKLLNIVSKIPL